jgi:hypothetical protein
MLARTLVVSLCFSATAFAGVCDSQIRTDLSKLGLDQNIACRDSGREFCVTNRSDEKKTIVYSPNSKDGQTNEDGQMEEGSHAVEIPYGQPLVAAFSAQVGCLHYEIVKDDWKPNKYQVCTNEKIERESIALSANLATFTRSNYWSESANPSAQHEPKSVTGTCTNVTPKLASIVSGFVGQVRVVDGRGAAILSASDSAGAAIVQDLVTGETKSVPFGAIRATSAFNWSLLAKTVEANGRKIVSADDLSSKAWSCVPTASAPNGDNTNVLQGVARVAFASVKRDSNDVGMTSSARATVTKDFDSSKLLPNGANTQIVYDTKDLSVLLAPQADGSLKPVVVRYVPRSVMGPAVGVNQDVLVIDGRICVR